MSKETEEDYSSETQSEHPSQDVTNQEVEKNKEEEEEEEETCGFCIFMKGGGCKEQFEAWSTCVDTEREADKDFTETCREAVRDNLTLLYGCMKDVMYGRLVLSKELGNFHTLVFCLVVYINDKSLIHADNCFTRMHASSQRLLSTIIR
jgi:hypothetical protein